jgi:hypothetical protein
MQDNTANAGAFLLADERTVSVRDGIFLRTSCKKNDR